jgi:MFS transporter, MHS family, shikimate and dehydroshikimate transport protein
MPGTFGTGTRYSGASLGCQVAAALSGGFALVIATGLLIWQGNTYAACAFMIGLALVPLLAVLMANETVRRPMRS